jgi:hypothetical protein
VLRDDAGGIADRGEVDAAVPEDEELEIPAEPDGERVIDGDAESERLGPQ